MSADDVHVLPLGAVHDPGCTCWPHVSQSDYNEIAHLEYLDGLHRLGRIERAIADVESEADRTWRHSDPNPANRWWTRGARWAGAHIAAAMTEPPTAVIHVDGSTDVPQADGSVLHSPPSEVLR